MFYKILPSNLCSYGYQYKMGINRMEKPDTFGMTIPTNEDCYEAGLYFADSDNILAYCHYGEYIATVEAANGARLEYWGKGEYSTDILQIMDIRPLWNISTLKELEKEGVNFSVDDYAILSWAEELGKTDIASFLKSDILG